MGTHSTIDPIWGRSQYRTARQAPPSITRRCDGSRAPLRETPGLGVSASSGRCHSPWITQYAVAPRCTRTEQWLGERRQGGRRDWRAVPTTTETTPYAAPPQPSFGPGAKRRPCPTTIARSCLVVLREATMFRVSLLVRLANIGLYYRTVTSRCPPQTAPARSRPIHVAPTRLSARQIFGSRPLSGCGSTTRL